MNGEPHGSPFIVSDSIGKSSVSMLLQTAHAAPKAYR